MVQLIVLIAVFIALPILLYAVVRATGAERDIARFQAGSARADLVAAGLAPALEQSTPADAERLTRELARYESDGLRLKLFFRPPATSESSGVFFIASGTALSAEMLRAETSRLQGAGIFQVLIEQCGEAGPRDTTVIADALSVTTATRVRSAYGCWGIVADFAAPAVAPIWSNPALRITGFVYAGIVLLALASAVWLLINLGRARALEVEAVPERAEPVLLAAPAAAPESPPLEAEAEKTALAADPFEAGGVDIGLIEVARQAIDLSQIVQNYLAEEARSLGDENRRLHGDIESGIIMSGRADFVATILAELVGGALKDGGTVRVTLSTARDESRRRALLTVAQTGGAIADLGRLPLIKQFLAALGAVSAESRDAAGAIVRVAFPA